MRYLKIETIRSPRLLLRQFEAADALQIAGRCGADELNAHVNVPMNPFCTIATAIDFMQVEQADGRASRPCAGFWAVERDGLLVGFVGIYHIDWELRACEMGYWVDSPYRGQGIATEAVRAVIGYLFDTCGFNRVYAQYNARNLACGKVLQKAGMSYEGTMREATRMPDGTYGDLMQYAILKAEWQEIRF